MKPGKSFPADNACKVNGDANSPPHHSLEAAQSRALQDQYRSERSVLALVIL